MGFLVFLYGLSFAFSILFGISAFVNTKVAVAVLAVYSSEIISSLIFGRIFFKEKISIVKIISLVLVGLGIFFITYPFSISSLNIGFIYGTLSGLCWTVSNMFLKNFNRKIGISMLIFIQLFSTFLLGIILILLNKSTHLLSMSTPTLLVAIIFGVMVIAIGFLIVYGFQNFDLNLGTIVVSSEIFFSPFFAALFFHEFPSFLEFIGGILVILAVISTQLNFTKVKK